MNGSPDSSVYFAASPGITLAATATPADERLDAKGRKVIWLLLLLLAAAFAALVFASFSRF